MFIKEKQFSKMGKGILTLSLMMALSLVGTFDAKADEEIARSIGGGSFGTVKEREETTRNVGGGSFGIAKEKKVYDGQTRNLSVGQFKGEITAKNLKKDKNGNPRVEVKTTIDASAIENANKADVVVIMDSAYVMNSKVTYGEYKTICDEQRKVLKEFATSIVRPGVRVSVVSDRTKNPVCELSEDVSVVTNAFDNYMMQSYNSGRYIGDAMKVAKEQLKNSTAKKKEIILVVNGNPFNSYRAERLAKDAKEAGVEITVVAYKYDGDAEKVKEIATADKFYAINNEKDMKAKLNGVKEAVDALYNSKLTLNIPQGTKIEGNVIYTEGMLPTMSKDGKTLMFKWKNNYMENKVYEVKYVLNIDKNLLTKKIADNNELVYPCGATIITRTTKSVEFSGYEVKVACIGPELDLDEVFKGVKPVDERDNIKGDLDDSPATGDEFDVTLFVALVGAALVMTASVIVIKKREVE